MILATTGNLATLRESQDLLDWDAPLPGLSCEGRVGRARLGYTGARRFQLFKVSLFVTSRFFLKVFADL